MLSQSPVPFLFPAPLPDTTKEPKKKKTKSVESEESMELMEGRVCEIDEFARMLCAEIMGL